MRIVSALDAHPWACQVSILGKYTKRRLRRSQLVWCGGMLEFVRPVQPRELWRCDSKKPTLCRVYTVSRRPFAGIDAITRALLCLFIATDFVTNSSRRFHKPYSTSEEYGVDYTSRIVMCLTVPARQSILSAHKKSNTEPKSPE